MAECGILLPDAAGEVLEISGSWRRPMLAATDAFLMVCPYQGDEGQELFTHPAWDEIACFAGDKKYLLTGSNLKACPAKKPRPGLAMPKPVEAWQGPINTFQLRETESASSLQSLCGCSFKYLLQYWCKIGSGGGWSLPSQARLEGLLMHEIIDEVFQSWPMSPDQAAKEAEKLLHARGPMLAANLFLPGRKAALAQTRRTLTGAVKALVEHLSEADLAPTKTEESLQLDIPELGFNLFGRPDMVAQNNVIDFKRSGSKFWLECLGNGSATQLACYGRLLNPQQKDSLWPPAAIFILRDARMISLGRRAFPNVEPADGPSLAETWNGLVALVQARRNQLSEGDIKALGLMEACPDSSCLGPEGLEIAPSCDYCDYCTLCGNAFRG